MKKNFVLICAAACTFALFSCKKDSSNNNAITTDITGTWNFESLTADTWSEGTNSLGGTVAKTVATSNYTSTNNSGVWTVDASNMAITNLNYSVNTIGYYTLYEDGVITDTFSTPFSQNVAAYNGAAPYTRVNNDSVYFSQGVTFLGGTPGTSQPSGARIKVENGKLYMYQNVDQVSTPAAGVTQHIKANTTIVFHR